MSRAVMQQALEALEGLADYRYTERVKQALVALKQALAEPEQHDTDCHAQGICQRSGYSIANTPRRPLSDEEIKAALVSTDPETKRLPPGFRDFARAIERAHGIGEQHE